MKKVGLIDVIVTIAVILALAVGLFTYMHFRQTADKQIQDNAKIAFQVYLRGVTITSGANPIRVGDETFISIRNVPYTKLQIIDSRIDTKKVVMPNPNKKPAFVAIDDYSQMFMYDILVTVQDMAKITKDGAVIGGNKIKIGMPITLEGIDYKFNGTVSNVQMLVDKPAPQQQPQPQAGATQPQTTKAPQTPQAGQNKPQPSVKK